jgi:ribosomal protein S12 methylthiotransferase
VKKRLRICLVSLGCSKNLVDSEHMLGLLKAHGHEIVSDCGQADVAVVNTCGFIQSAVEEALSTLGEMIRLKKKGTIKRLFVTGCMVQRYGAKLKREIPEVDGWLGTGEYQRIGFLVSGEEGPPRTGFYVGRPIYLADHTVPRIRSTPFYTGYIKIAEGCSHKCSYCIIPNLRGAFRSRDPASVLSEAHRMGAEGVRELNLVAQDTTHYGRDLSPPTSIESLLEGLLKVEGISWIRLLYSHPQNISEGLLDLIDSNDKICPYLDIPFQHVNGALLTAMGRGRSRETPYELIDRIRSRSRKIAIRTTLMVGFPGETEAMFQELLDFVKQVAFERLGVFAYSPEKGTRAARIAANVTLKAAEKRRDAIMRRQAKISKRNHLRLVGQVARVLVEGVSRETDLLLTGRTATMAPDVDGQVLINKGAAPVGQIVPVRITEAYAYDLVGEILQ